MNNLGITRISRNPVKYNLTHGGVALGTWLSLCSPVAAEMMANLGWDWLVVDVEHSPVGFETMVNCFRAAQLGGAVPMARVPWNDTIWIQRTLDAGALGLVIPMINSAEDAAQAVANTRYALKGVRSWGGSRIAPYIDGDYGRWVGDNLAIIVMIETAEAVRRAESILAVDGVDGCFIGPSDLTLTLGYFPGDPKGKELLEAAVTQVRDAGRKVGKAVGRHCFSVAEANRHIEEGFQFIALASDARYMTLAAQEWLKQIKR